MSRRTVHDIVLHGSGGYLLTGVSFTNSSRAGTLMWLSRGCARRVCQRACQNMRVRRGPMVPRALGGGRAHACDMPSATSSITPRAPHPTLQDRQCTSFALFSLSFALRFIPLLRRARFFSLSPHLFSSSTPLTRLAAPDKSDPELYFACSIVTSISSANHHHVAGLLSELCLMRVEVV
jgi:hypothetical protein